MYLRAIFVSIVLLTHAALAQTTARIQGTVNDDSGKPVTAAHVVAALQSLTDHSTYSAVTGPKGEYALDNLKPGQYSLCTQAPGGPHLNPCQWSTGPQATVAAGQTIANQALTVTKGAILQLRLDDPQKLITPSDDIFLVVYLPSGLFQPLRLVSRDAAGRTYDVAVPLKNPVRLAIISSHLQMVDDKGNGLAPHAVQNSNAPAAATNSVVTFPGQSAVNGPPVTFTITGRK
jgi:hypothetical protein